MCNKFWRKTLHGENQYKKKEHNLHSSVFKQFKNNDP